MQRNFILTDVMKTGFHVDLEDFINLHSLTNQTFDDDPSETVPSSIIIIAS